MYRTISVVLATSLIGACAHNSVQSRAPMSGLRLTESSTVYISLPADGRYSSTTYSNSGFMTAAAFEGALVSHVDTVVMGQKIEDKAEALNSARSTSATYLFVPKIIHWEDRATEWSGKRDRLEVFVSVVDVATEIELDRATIKGNSRWFTFGGDHPQDILAEPINQYVSSLFPPAF